MNPNAQPPSIAYPVGDPKNPEQYVVVHYPAGPYASWRSA